MVEPQYLGFPLCFKTLVCYIEEKDKGQKLCAPLKHKCALISTGRMLQDKCAS